MNFDTFLLVVEGDLACAIRWTEAIRKLPLKLIPIFDKLKNLLQGKMISFSTSKGEETRKNVRRLRWKLIFWLYLLIKQQLSLCSIQGSMGLSSIFVLVCDNPPRASIQIVSCLYFFLPRLKEPVIYHSKIIKYYKLVLVTQIVGYLSIFFKCYHFSKDKIKVSTITIEGESRLTS